MKILLAVSGKDDGKLVVDFAANYGWPPGTEMKVVHVVGSCVDESQSIAAQQSAEELTDWLCTKLRNLTNCELTYEVLRGSPIFELLQEASNWHANMIVMGARTKDLSMMQAGSVSKAVALEAPCSVVIIRPPIPGVVEQSASKISTFELKSS